MSAPEAFVLLTLPETTLTAPDVKESGTLNLVCVTVHHPDAPAEADRDVYLMMRVGDVETPIDPAGTIERTDEPGSRTYTFHSTDIYPADRVLKVPTKGSDQYLAEDLETFDSLLSQYGELRGANSTVPSRTPSPSSAAGEEKSADKPGNPTVYDGDLRGHIVAINQDTGEVIGQLDDKHFKLHEDPKMHEQGHEDDAVYIEVPENLTPAQEDANAMQMFIQAIPPDEQDWITKSATIVSTVISQTTSLLLTTINVASSMYIANSAPSPHHPSEAAAAAARSPTGAPPQPPRALTFLTAESTRKNLGSVHAVSGAAVTVSQKTVSIIDGMIRRAMGGKPKQNRLLNAANAAAAASNAGSKVPSRSVSPAPGPSKAGSSAPPPYEISEKSTSAPPPLPPRSVSDAPTEGTSGTPPPLPPRLRKRERVLLSLDLILSTFDHEARRFLEEGSQTVGTVVGHKYGPQAAESSMHIAGAAKNVGLVYVDLHGVGRRALLKRAGTEWVKARIRNS